MLKLALSQLRAAPRRYISVLLAILIGVTFLAASLLVGTSSNAMLRNSLGETYSQADLVVAPSQNDFEAGEQLAVQSGPPAVGPDATDENGEAVTGVGAMDEVDGVSEAHPAVTSTAGLTLPQDMRDAGEEGTYTSTSDFAMISPVPQHHDLIPEPLSSGEYPASDSDREITVDAETAERLDLTVGDQTTLQVPLPGGADSAGESGENSEAAVPVEISGITERSSDPFAVGSVQIYTGSQVFSDIQLPDLNEASGAEASQGTPELGSTEYVAGAEYVLIQLADGANAGAVTDALQQHLDDAGIQATVDTPEGTAQQQVSEMAGSNVFVYILGAFAIIALVVTMLVISNTFSVLVAQRTRQLALQRVLGATRRQIRGAVLIEAIVVGLVGSAIGVGLACALVAGLVAVGQNIEGLSAVTFAADPVQMLMAVAIGVVMTTVASLIPAARATRVSPLAAMRPVEDTTVGSKAGVVRMVFGGLLTLAGAALLVFGALTSQLLIAVAGGVVSFIGLLMLAVLFVPRAVFTVGALSRPAGVPGRMAQLNSVRNRSRTTATATALLVGTTLVAMMLTGGRIAQDQADSVLGANYPVDLYTQLDAGDSDGAGNAEQAEQAADRVADLDGVSNSVALTQAGTLDNGEPVYAIDPDALDDVGSRISDDARAELREPGTVMVPSSMAPDDGGALTEQNSGTELSVASVEAASLDALVSTETAEQLAGGSSDSGGAMLWINVTEDVDMNALNDLVAEIGEAADVSSESVEGPAAERMLYTQIIDMMLLTVTALLAVSVLIALIGVANTLSLSTIERTRENSLMRALGLTKKGLRGMLALEAVLISGVAALLGCVLGVVYGWFGAQAVFGQLRADSGLDQLVPVSVPIGFLLVILAVAVLAGLLASVAPARRAVNLPPVAGLAVE